MKFSVCQKCWILVLCSLFTALSLQAQRNPFELTPRLKAQPQPEKAVEEPGENTAEEQQTAPLNPFDIVAAPVDPAPAASKALTSASPTRKKAVVAHPDGRFRLVMTFVILTLITIFVTLFRPYIDRVYRSVFNENLMSQYFRERETGRYLPYNLLFFLFFINAGFFVYLISRYYGVVVFANPYQSIGWMVGTIMGLFLLKQIMLEFLAVVFPIEKEARLYSFSVTLFSIFLGLLLIPINLLVAYAPDNMTFPMIILGFAAIVFVYGLRALRGVFIANKFLVGNFFHFLLYICTVEIGPVVLLTKFIKDMI
jgi:hypothetical protein